MLLAETLWKHDLAQTGYEGLKMQNCENFAAIHESCLINETNELTPHVQFNLYESLMFWLLGRKLGGVWEWPIDVQESRINYRREDACLDILTEKNSKSTKHEVNWERNMQHDICIFVGSKEMPSICQIKWRNWTKLLDKDISLNCLCTFPGQKWVWSVKVINQYFMYPLYKQGSIYLFWDLRLVLNSCLNLNLFSSISTWHSIWLSWMLCLLLQVLSRMIFFWGVNKYLLSSVIWKCM